MVKLFNGKTIKIDNIDKFNDKNVELLKMLVAYQSNISIDKFELRWNNQILSPDSLLLKDVEANREKLPETQFNVNNLIFMILN